MNDDQKIKLESGKDENGPVVKLTSYELDVNLSREDVEELSAWVDNLVKND